MIIEFSVANFMSFKNKVTLSMLANSTNGLNSNYIEINNKKILKTSAVYGGNASGKSNLFKILSIVILMLRNSNNININAKLPLIPFKFDKTSASKPTEFEIRFIVENIRYVYGFRADSNKIYDEYLYYYPNGRETLIFDRTNINEYHYSQKDERFLKTIEEKNSENKFFLATLTAWNYKKTKPVYQFLTNDINVCFDIEELKNIAFYQYEIDDGRLKKFALDFLKKADFNIIDYQISKIDIPKELLVGIPDFFKKDLIESPKAFQVLFKHKGSNNFLDMGEESLGTQMMFAFIPFICDAINHNKVLIIDELDRSLHPYLVHYIVELFNNPDINKNCSQLIFNTHDTNLLDLKILRRDQIWFTEKNNDNGESDLYSLSDFKIRKTDNIEKGYLLGKYGAVPFIKNDINLW